MSDTATLHERLEALRRQGVASVAPAHWFRLQALVRRMDQQAPAVQALLRPRAEAQVDALQARLAGQPAAPRPTHVTAAPAVTWPQARAPQAPQDLPAATRFRRTWSRSQALDSVARAAAQRPVNAGPLNSHMLALQALDLMQTLPAGYLHRFVAQVQALQWLEAVAPQVAPPGKPRRPAPRRRA